MEGKLTSLQPGDTAPDFVQDSTEGVIQFHQWPGNSWDVPFSHPGDVTPVCTTELGEVARPGPAFDQRNVKVIGLSADGLAEHNGWKGDIAETQGCALKLPLLPDPDRNVSKRYGMIHPEANDTLAVRSVFVIDDRKKVRLALTYPASTAATSKRSSASSTACTRRTTTRWRHR